MSSLFVARPNDGCIGAMGQANVAQGDQWSVGMPFKWIFTSFSFFNEAEFFQN